MGVYLALKGNAGMGSLDGFEEGSEKMAFRYTSSEHH